MVNQTKTEKNKKSSTPMLDSFSTDISRLALENKLDPIIGRDSEIERLSQILTRRKKNNPVLIGEPGVGKTAVIEGLALRIMQKTVPRLLWGQRVVALDMAGLIAGTKYRGQFEERIKGMIQELENSNDIIVFIDELHTMVGAGGATGYPARQRSRGRARVSPAGRRRSGVCPRGGNSLVPPPSFFA